jgi:hypothetical protein
MRRLRKDSPYWFTTPQKHPNAKVIEIPSFSARGMRLIYGRDDHFPIPNEEEYVRLFGWSEIRINLRCGMNIWQRKDGRIFLRFRASHKCLESFSFELVGPCVPKELKRGTLLDESWVPQVLRQRYNEWLEDCLEYPDGD